MADEGLEVRLNNCDLAAKEIRAATRRALETIGLLAEGYAQDKCPVGTPESTGIPNYVGGTLRDSITHEVDGDSVYVGTNVYYAPYVELGTRHMDPRPYLRPAATEHGSQYRQVIKRELGG